MIFSCVHLVLATVRTLNRSTRSSKTRLINKIEPPTSVEARVVVREPGGPADLDRAIIFGVDSTC